MLGTILNVTAILVGGVIGLTVGKDLSPAWQSRLKAALGILSMFVGMRMTWGGLRGGFSSIMAQLGIVMLALVLGNLIGKMLGLQRRLNQLGKYAKDRYSARPGEHNNRFSDGFITCSLLFCVGPMSILGSVQDGLTGTFQILAIKSVMDGLATLAFAKTFGSGVLLSSIPVLAYQGTLTIGARALEPILTSSALLDSVNATGGLLICCVALVILDLKKVPLADYLPSLALAPLLTWLWR